MNKQHTISFKVINPEKECLSLAAQRLGIDILSYWRAVVEEMRPHVKVLQDAVEMLKELKKLGFSVYPATSNSSFAILSKMGAGGLAENMQTSYFTTLGGGSEIWSEGKTSPDFFRAVLNHHMLLDEETAMVGDSPEIDLGYAQAGGISKIFIVDRNQEEDWTLKKDKGIYVKSLIWVPHMLKLPSCGCK